MGRVTAVITSAVLLALSMATAQQTDVHSQNPAAPAQKPVTTPEQHPNPGTQSTPPSSTPGQQQPPLPVTPESTVKQDEGQQNPPILTGRTRSEVGTSNLLPSGAEIKARVDHYLPLQLGQRISMIVSESVRNAKGDTVIPAGTKLQVETQQTASEHVKRSVRIVSMTPPDGETVQMKDAFATLSSSPDTRQTTGSGVSQNGTEVLLTLDQTMALPLR